MIMEDADSGDLFIHGKRWTLLRILPSHETHKKKVLILQHNLTKSFNRIHHFLTLIFRFLMVEKVTYDTPLINSHF